MRIHNRGKWLVLLPLLALASAVEASQLINLSTRAYLGGDGPLVHGGVVLQQVDSPKMIAVRVRGPSLPIPHKMPNPALRVFNHQRVLIDQNDDWMTHPSAPILVEHGLAPTDPREPAIAMSVRPGRYMVVAHSSDGASGEVVISVTDMETLEPLRIINLSTRAYVDNAQALAHGGLVIQGVGREHVVVRAKGPSLPLADAMPDPLLKVYELNADGSVPRLIDVNDDWMEHETAALMEEVDLAPPHPKEPGIALSLLPGRYTAVVEPADGQAGETVVSVTEIPAGTIFDLKTIEIDGNDVIGEPIVVVGASQAADGSYIVDAVPQDSRDNKSILHEIRMNPDGVVLGAQAIDFTPFAQDAEDYLAENNPYPTGWEYADPEIHGTDGDIYLRTRDGGLVGFGRLHVSWPMNSSFSMRMHYLWSIKLNPENKLQWRTYSAGGSADDRYWSRLESVEETTDSGFCVGITAGEPSVTHAFVQKNGIDGDLEWKTRMPTDAWDNSLRDLDVTDDGGCIALAAIWAEPDSIAKYTADGELVWVHRLADEGFLLAPGRRTEFAEAIATGDGGVLVFGHQNVYSEDREFRRFSIVAHRLDADGNSLWTRYYTDPDWEQIGRDSDVRTYGNGVVVETVDHGYLYVSGPSSIEAHSEDVGELSISILVLKLDQNGNEQWQQYLDGPSGFVNAAIIEVKRLDSGKYLIVGSADAELPQESGQAPQISSVIFLHELDFAE